jgi:hypothetical protein
VAEGFDWTLGDRAGLLQAVPIHVIEVRAEWRMKTDAPVEPLVENNFIHWRLSLNATRSDPDESCNKERLVHQIRGVERDARPPPILADVDQAYA